MPLKAVPDVLSSEEQGMGGKYFLITTVFVQGRRSSKGAGNLKPNVPTMHYMCHEE